MSYAVEKLGLAIYELAIGAEDIKIRLKRAFRHICAVDRNDLPEALAKDWGSIIDRLTKRVSKWKGTEYDEGRLKATLYRMHKKTAVKIAKDIVELHSQLEDYFEENKH